MQKFMARDIQRQFHFGVYGVLEKENRILSVQKVRGPYKGLFDLPGGKPEHGESIHKALTREILEETGLIIQKTSFLIDFSALTAYVSINNLPTELHHLGLIYTITTADFSMYDPSIFQEDVNGSIWLEKSLINRKNCSPLLTKVLENEQK